MSSDRNIEHLRFLSDFYMNLIETKQIQMNIAERQFLADRSNVKAYKEWTGNKIKICDLYEGWLNQLLKCHVATFDDVARTMYAMMLSDCYWFLAKMNKKPISRISKLSNYSQACEALESVFVILKETVDYNNAFYQHVLSKYQKLVTDYRNAIGESSLYGSSRHVPVGMTHWDIFKCKEAINFLNQQQQIGRRSEPKSNKQKITAKTITSQISNISRILLNTLV